MQIVKNNTLFYGSLLLLECFFWGTGNPVAKIVMSSITPFYCLIVRFAIASMVFAAIFGRSFIAQMKREYLIPGMIVSFFTTLTFATSNLALLYTASTVAGFLMSLAVIFTPLLARFFLGTLINPLSVFPITLVVLGMYYLCGAGGAFNFGLGEFYAVLSSISGACMLVAGGRYLSDEISPMVMSVMQTFMMTLFCVPFALVFEKAPNLAALPPMVWAGILYLALACSCAAYIIQNHALSKVPATYVALIFCSEPLFTAAASYLLLDETLNGAGLLGAAMIAVSIAVASLIPEQLDYRSRTVRIGRISAKRTFRYLGGSKRR